MSHAPRYRNTLAEAIADVILGRADPIPIEVALFC